MHIQRQQEQAEEIGCLPTLSDQLIAEIATVLKKRLLIDLSQLHTDPWTWDQRRKGLHFDP